MMLSTLKKCLNSEKKESFIFDIFVYGSTVKGKRNPHDLDLLIVFLEGTLRERLEIVQRIKGKLKALDVIVDCQQVLLKELFSSSFFARSGVLLEGVSVFDGKKVSEKMGFNSWTLFWYELKGLTHTQKVKFNYILAGRGDLKGILGEFGAIRLVSGVVKVPIEKSLLFEEILKQNNVKYWKKNILEES